MKSWHSILIGIFIGLILSAAILLIALPPRGTPVELLPIPTAAPIAVDVGGAVQSPGVYLLPQGSRVEGAVQAAGGFQDNAERKSINLAAQLKDGEKVYIPALDESDPFQSPARSPSGERSAELILSESPINLNTATLEELQTLPGIGEARANDIIEYRVSHAGFMSIEEIQNVPGIGPVMFDRIKDLIFVE